MNIAEQNQEIKQTITNALDVAKRHWKNGGYQLNKGVFDSSEGLICTGSLTNSRIPEYSIVNDEETIIDNFIALVIDMRDSTKHLMCKISERTAKVSQLERVFYETSALLPALELAISFYNGSVTEYLGDGVLAFFRIPEEKKDEIIKKAFRATKYCLNDVRKILNDILREEFGLPEISLGAGLAYSKAIVSTIGLPNKKYAKIFGECVYYATKLSYGVNEIYVNEQLYNLWPSSKGGSLTFNKRNNKSMEYYKIISS